MEMLDRYIAAVGKHLPRKTRADIENEIRSTLEDMLEDRGRKTAHPVDEAMLQDVLKEYGAPEQVAATYLPERSLIGPGLYPSFILVAKIVFTVLTTLTIIGLGISLGTGSAGINAIARTLGLGLFEFVRNMAAALGYIVLVFAILERVIPSVSLTAQKSAGKDWDPAVLMKEPDPATVRIWEPVLSIVFAFALIVLFNFYPQFIGFTPSLNEFGTGNVIFYPILSEVFFHYLPALDLLWICVIAMNVVLLRMGRWNKATRWSGIGIRLLGLGIATAMLFGPGLVTLSQEALSAFQGLPFGWVELNTLLNQLVRVVLGIIILSSIAELLKDGYRLFIGPGSIKAITLK